MDVKTVNWNENYKPNGFDKNSKNVIPFNSLHWLWKAYQSKENKTAYLTTNNDPTYKKSSASLSKIVDKYIPYNLSSI